MTSSTDRCPTCGWDGDDLCKAIVLLLNENAAQAARMAKLERVAETSKLVQSVNVADGAYYRDAHERLDDALRALDAETEAG